MPRKLRMRRQKSLSDTAAAAKPPMMTWRIMLPEPASRYARTRCIWVSPRRDVAKDARTGGPRRHPWYPLHPRVPAGTAARGLRGPRRMSRRRSGVRVAAAQAVGGDDPAEHDDDEQHGRDERQRLDDVMGEQRLGHGLLQ